MELRNEPTGQTRLGKNFARKFSTHASRAALRRFSGGTFSALNRSGASADRRIIFRLSAESRYAKLNRQPHGESRPDIFLACHFNRPAVRLDDRLGNGEAEAVAAGGTRFVRAIKPFKHT